MRSRLYECLVMHARFHPRAHRFAYRLFFLALDLDELPALAARLRLLRFDRPGLLSFRQRDYLPTHDPLHNPSDGCPTAPQVGPSPNWPPAAADLSPLKARVLSLLASRGIDPGPDARVLLLTLPRVLGYQFNPVSFYFISAADGRPVASIAEVTNTFRETKPYLLGPDTLESVPPPASLASRSPLAATTTVPSRDALSPEFSDPSPAFRLRIPKHFYVSPFSDVDAAFDFCLRPPGAALAIQIDDYVDGRRSLISTVTGRGPPCPLRDRVLAWFSLKYPLVTLKVIAAIHWEALRLYAKRVPWFTKSARAADQRDLYHPHGSLIGTPPAPALPPQSAPSVL